MLKRKQEQITTLVRVADVFITVCSFLAAYYFRSNTQLLQEANLGPIDSLLWLLAASITIHTMIYPALGFYRSIRLRAVTNILSMIFRAAAVEFFILASLVFFLQAKDTSRSFFMIFLAVNYGLVILERIGGRILLASVRKRGYNFRQVLIVGTGGNAARVIQSLARNKHWGYVACGLLREAGAAHALTDVNGVPVLGDLADLRKVVDDRAVDEVYFAMDRIDAPEVSRQVELCEELGIPSRFSLGFFELSHSQVTFQSLDGVPMITFYTTLMTPAQALFKRVIDILVSFVGLLLTTALYPWISWRIRKESPGPVIFKQLRVGENGRRFKCYKFRTMFPDAESRKAELMASNQMDGPIFKVENDPRVTPFGAFLRKTSLDELPQFFNILRGDMSVVGTRPPTPDEVAKYQTHYRRRLSIRPGLTGLWQVSGRSEIRRFEDILALDLHYIDHWSIWLDIRIIFRTIWVTLFRRGAH